MTSKTEELFEAAGITFPRTPARRRRPAGPLAEDLRILSDYLAILTSALEADDQPKAAMARATMSQALDAIARVVDPRREYCAALTHSNGVYVPPVAPEVGYPIIDRSAARAKILASIDPGEADRDYAEWQKRAGLI